MVLPPDATFVPGGRHYPAVEDDFRTAGGAAALGATIELT
jgi:hypothetical protein